MPGMPSPIMDQHSVFTMYYQHVARNERGTDFIVGDIHGCFRKLAVQLEAIGFHAEVDRLFCTGDLVDCGPDCHEVIDWIGRPWFFSVLGNHDDNAIRWPEGRMDEASYRQGGGGWNIANTPQAQSEIAEMLRFLPVAIELETEGGLVGIVHAECPRRSWSEMLQEIETPVNLLARDGSVRRRKDLFDDMLWQRRRFEDRIKTPVEGVRAVVVGHNWVDGREPMPFSLGNTLYIDTAAWMFARQTFCILRADTLRPAEMLYPHLLEPFLQDEFVQAEEVVPREKEVRPWAS